MSEPSAFGFGQFVPGFDFLQSLSKNATAAQPAAATGMPGMASWVAPTLSIEDIDKRIQELKSVLFWLEQNATALKATIQAMEVQKMTLTTLQSMNVNMADLAKAFTAKPPTPEPATAAPFTTAPAPAPAPSTPKPSLFTSKSTPASAAEPETPVRAEPAANNAAFVAQASTLPGAASQPAVDPMQWWGALTQQFQGIAAVAMKDVAGEAMRAGMAVKKPKAVKTPADRKTPAVKKAAAQTAKTAAPRRAHAKTPSTKTVRSPSKPVAEAPRKSVKKKSQEIKRP